MVPRHLKHLFQHWEDNLFVSVLTENNNIRAQSEPSQLVQVDLVLGGGLDPT